MTEECDERALREQLTDFYHLVDYMGWSELVFNHISVRIPGREHNYLVNPFGLNYTEICPENLLTVNVSGELVAASNYPANPAGFSLHGVIHENRPDVTCIAHTHTSPISAVAMKKNGLDHNTFYGAQLYGRVAYHDFEGITLYQDERKRLLDSLGDKHVLVLRNHGIAVCERDIPSAFMLLWTVQRAAEIQCQAGMIPGPDTPLSEQVKKKCAEDARSLTGDGGFAQLNFDAQVRRMRAARG